MPTMKQIAVLTAFIAAMTSSVLVTNAEATPIVGSLTLSSDGVVDNGQDLLTRNVFTPENLHVGLRTGNFTLVANGSPITGGTLDLNDIASYTFTITGVGTFTDIGSGNEITTRDASNLNVYLLGMFTPDANGALGAFDVSASSVRFSLTRTGSINEFSISFSGTEAAPPTNVPEPISLALLGSGLFGIGMLRRRRG